MTGSCVSTLASLVFSLTTDSLQSFKSCFSTNVCDGSFQQSSTPPIISLSTFISVKENFIFKRDHTDHNFVARPSMFCINSACTAVTCKDLFSRCNDYHGYILTLPSSTALCILLDRTVSLADITVQLALSNLKTEQLNSELAFSAYIPVASTKREQTSAIAVKKYLESRLNSVHAYRLTSPQRPANSLDNNVGIN